MIELFSRKKKTMRIRRKKHLTERVLASKEYLLVADYSEPDMRKIPQNVKPFDFEELFGNKNPVCLEIGCGMGGFITEVAKRNEDKNYFAVEIIQNIAVSAAEKIKENGLKNVRVFNCGAEYLPRYIKQNSIENIYLNFSPPFPGKRYENRRLTYPMNLKNYNSFLIEGGKIYQKTDDKEFFLYSLEQFRTNGFLVEDCTEKIVGDKDNVVTEYEKKFTDLGLKIYALTAIKN